MSAVPYNFITIYHCPAPGGPSIPAPQVVNIRIHDPTFFTLALPAPAAFENTSLSVAHRAYCRAVQVHALGSAVGLYAWQGQYIFGLTASPNWSVVHGPIANQTSALQYGVHSGLYLVQRANGNRSYLCGLYRGTISMGYVKFDIQAGVWSSGLVNGTAPGSANTFSTCCAYRGELVTCLDGLLHFFNPATNEIRSISYSAKAAIGGSSPTSYDKVRVVRGRLFIIAGGSSDFVLLEYAWGGISYLAHLFTHGVNFGGGGDYTPGPFDDNRIWVMGYSTTGGTGIRATRITIDTEAQGGAVTVEDKTATVVDPLLAYPTSLLSSANTGLWFTNENCYDPKGAGQVWGRLTNYNNTGSLFSNTGSRVVDWHFTIPWTYNTSNPNTYQKGYAYPISQYGTVEYLQPEFPIQILSARPYADDTVSGILIEFFVITSAPPSLRLQYGEAITRQALPNCTLSIGDGIQIAPGATLNVGDKRIDGLVRDDTTVHQIIWDYSADGVADNSWVLVKAYGFTVGFEALGLYASSTGHMIAAYLGGGIDSTPLQTSDLPKETTLVTSASPLKTSDLPKETSTLTSASPLQTSDLPKETTTDADYFGRVYGRVANRAHTESTGVQLLVDGTPQGGLRPNVNVTNTEDPRFLGSQGTVVDQGDRPKAQLEALLSAFPLSEPGRLVRVSGVDATVVAPTDLLEVPVGYECVVTGVSARVTSGSPTIPAIAGVGANGTQDDILASQFMTGLLSAPSSYSFIAGGLAAIAVAGDVIRLGVDVAADAAQVLEITLFGYLRTA